MALPKIDTPIYELDLPLSKKRIRFRPFLVKEQRNLLMALEAEDNESIEQNIKQVLHNCTLTEDVDIEKLPVTDVEYYFLNLRARSVGEVAENRYRCNNEVDGKECGNIMEVDVNLLDIKVDMPENITDTISLSNNMTVKLKYPEFSIIKEAKDTSDVSEFAIKMIASSIEYIHDGEQFYYASEVEQKELVDFVDSLNQQQFAKLEEFFNNLPRLQKTVDFTCSKCGFQHKLELEGLNNFFV
ncbi:MAG: baseplate protein [Proteobacteria bacterium]|nr:baseplate protein [Pseudomonadota bacterium]